MRTKKKHGFFARLIATVLALVLILGNESMITGSVVQAAASSSSTSSTTRISVHDPSIFYDSSSNSYYIYGSHLAQAKSSDLRNWSAVDTQGYTNESIYVSENVEGIYYIQNKFSGLYLDVVDGSTEDGANIQQWEYNGSQAQMFKFVSTGDGYYYILTGASNYTKCVDVDSGSSADGTNIMQWEYWGGDMQKYRVVQQADGTYAILTNASGCNAGLDVYEWSTENGGNINQWSFWGGDCQKWNLIEAQKNSGSTKASNGEPLETALASSFLWAGYNDQDCSGGYAVWAPDIIYNPDYVWNDGSKGAYMMYYSASSTYIRSCIGFAVSKSVDGPFSYVDSVVYSGFTNGDNEVTTTSSLGTKTVNTNYTNTNIPSLIEAGKLSSVRSGWFNSNGSFNNTLFPNAIDPTLVYDASGNLWMTYGSWSGGIYILQIDKATGLPIYPKSNSGQTDGYFGTRIAGGYGMSGEAPYIVYDSSNGYYYLYVTYGWLGSDGGYHIRVYRSKTINGTYTDASGSSAIYSSNSNQSKLGVKLFGNYDFSTLSTVGYKSGGHNSAFIDTDGQRYLVYHTRFDDGYEYHEVRVHQQFMNQDNWPVTAVYEYLGSTISQNGYSMDSMCGTYEFVNHGLNADTANVGMLSTKKVTLNSNGTISGDYSGTWSYTSGTYYCQMTIDGVTYKGVFFKQKDESSSHKEVMTFTLIGSDNRSIWGTKTSADTSATAKPSATTTPKPAATAKPSATSTPSSGSGGASWYVSPNGSDTNPGTESKPFASLMKAQDAASEGDTVYIMGGTYKNFDIAASDSNYNYIHQFTKSNITYRAYSSKDVPVFDFSGTTTDKRVAAFHIKSGVKGVYFLCFKVTGVPVGSQKQSECFRIEGNATFNQITCYNSNANGFYFCNHGTGSVIKCDAYNLYTSNSTSNSNTDGFGAHGDGVTFTQCRAWACGDDGYDCITSKGSNTFDGCWAYDMNKGGDSNGFKIGGYGTGTVPDTVPVHTVKYCLAACNGANGFYANHQPGQAANWYNNTAYKNSGSNYNMLERVSPTDSTDIAGTREVLRYNISYDGAIKNIGTGTVVGSCSWNSAYNCTSDDFQSLDASQMTKARGTNGELPTITFMQLTSNSDLQGMGCFDSSATSPTAAPTAKPTAKPSATAAPTQAPSGSDSSKSWNFKNSDFSSLGTISSTVTVDGLTLIATSEKTMSVNSNSQTVDGTTYTHCLALGGGGSTSYRAVKVPVTGSDVIKVILKSSGSSERTLVVADASGKQLGTITAGTSAALGTYNYSGSAGYVYLYSAGSGIHLYKIQVDSKGSGSTVTPTAAPTAKPTAAPTAKPTAAPTAKPTQAPVATAKPTAAPTQAPSVSGVAYTGSATIKGANWWATQDISKSDLLGNIDASNVTAIKFKSNTDFFIGYNGTSQYTQVSGKTEYTLTDINLAYSYYLQLALSKSDNVNYTITWEVYTDSASTSTPTAKPTAAPTAKPTAAPTAKPTSAPTAAPTQAPTGGDTSQSWNFKNTGFSSLGTISSNVTVDGLTLVATSAKTMSVSSNSQTVDGTTYSHCLALGGGGSTSYRAVKVPVTGTDTIKVILKSSGSSARTLVVADASGKQLGTITAGTSAALGTYTYSGNAGYVYLYSSGSGINLYKIQVDSKGSGSGSSSGSTPAPTAKPSATAAPTAAPSTASGDLFVSPSGKSSNSGTQNSPMDLATAIKKIAAGKTIWMTSGTYKLSSTIVIEESNSGKSGSYKSVRSYNGADVVLDFSSMSESGSNRGIVLDGDYWYFYGIDIKGAGDNGMLLSGNNNVIEMCQFYENHDSGLQLSRYQTKYEKVSEWPAYNQIINCTSYNNKDEATAENADGFAAKLTCGEGNVFDGCIAYCNSDDGWDLYAKPETGSIGVVTIKNCVAFGNGKLTDGSGSANGDMNGFKLGGSNGQCPTPHVVENSLAFNNGACGFTDNGNGGALVMKNCTSVNNGVYASKANYMCYRTSSSAKYSNLLSYSDSLKSADKFLGKMSNTVYANSSYYYISSGSFSGSSAKEGTKLTLSSSIFESTSIPGYSSGKYATNYHEEFRNADGSINMDGLFQVKSGSAVSSYGVGADLD